MKQIVSLFSIAAVMIISGCSATLPDQSSSLKPVKIGIITPIGGTLAGYGEDSVNLFQERLDAFRKTYPDIPVEMIIEDGKCNGKDASSAAQKLISIDQVDVIIGGLCSSETIAAGKIAQDNKVVLLSPISSAPSISDLGSYIYRFWNDAFAAKTVAAHLDTKMSKIAMITENTDYAQGFAKAYKKESKARVIDEQTFNSEEKDFDIIAKNISQLGDRIDGIVISNQSDATAVGLLMAFKNNGLLTKFQGKIYVAVGIDKDATLQTMKDQIEGVMNYTVADLMKPLANKEYIEAFSARYTIKGEAMYLIFHKEGIDLVLDAIKAGNKTSDSIKAYFDSITVSNQRKSGFGDFYFDQNGDAIGLDFSILQVQDNKTVSVSE